MVPVVRGADGNAYAADLAARVANGRAVEQALTTTPVDVLLDNGGTGLAFVVGDGGPDDLRLAHEVGGAFLCSHFIDPLVTAFQGLDWSVVWQCLCSDRWIKAVWDAAQVRELERFGVSNVIHLPMAATDRVYTTEPLDPRPSEPVVSFIGGQNTTYFDPGVTVATHNLLPGVLAHAINGDLRDVRFLDVYYDLYKLADPLSPDDTVEERIQKTAAYFSAKLYYNAALCIRNRDRFVIFLKRTLADRFRLVGRRWDTVYGLSTEPPLPTSDAYFQRMRDSAININLVNGNAETALNMRHFEITAAGGFMLCQDRAELHSAFEVGKECVTFSDERDLLEKIEYYLAHPRERVAIALAGQRRTLSEHLYSHRLDTLVGHFNSVLDTSSELVSSAGR